jgi:hypothetical protein
MGNPKTDERVGKEDIQEQAVKDQKRKRNVEEDIGYWPERDDQEKLRDL